MTNRCATQEYDLPEVFLPNRPSEKNVTSTQGFVTLTPTFIRQSAFEVVGTRFTPYVPPFGSSYIILSQKE